MTTKTLGQVLYEADYSAERNFAFPFSALDALSQAEYERMAQAVAAVVREQCAQACEAARPAGGRAWNPEQSSCFEALSHVADYIRAMK